MIDAETERGTFKHSEFGCFEDGFLARVTVLSGTWQCGWRAADFSDEILTWHLGKSLTI